MLGINSYYGWYEGKADRSTADIDDLAPYLRAMRDKYPGKALVITEFGAEATEPGPADVKQTYAFQTQYLKRNLDIIDRLGFMGGAIYWTAREFAVKPHWDGGAHPPDARLDPPQGPDLLRRQDQARVRRRAGGLRGDAAVPRRPGRRRARRALGAAARSSCARCCSSASSASSPR